MLDTSLGGKRSQILSWLLEKEGTFLNARACVLRNLYWHLSLSWSTTQHGQTYVDWHGSSTNQSGGVKDAALLFFVTTSVPLAYLLIYMYQTRSSGPSPCQASGRPWVRFVYFCHHHLANYVTCSPPPIIGSMNLRYPTLPVLVDH